MLVADDNAVNRKVASKLLAALGVEAECVPRGCHGSPPLVLRVCIRVASGGCRASPSPPLEAGFHFTASLLEIAEMPLHDWFNHII